MKCLAFLETVTDLKSYKSNLDESKHGTILLVPKTVLHTSPSPISPFPFFLKTIRIKLLSYHSFHFFAHLLVLVAFDKTEQFLLLENLSSLGFPGTSFPTIDNHSFSVFLLIPPHCLNH